MSRFHVERIGDAVLYLGDAAEVLPDLAKVDALVTDPPYGIGETNAKNLSRAVSTEAWKRPAATDYGDFTWDQTPISAELMIAARMRARWAVIFGGNYYDLPPTSCWLVWDKMTTGDFADCELAWTNLPKAVRRIRFLWNGFATGGGETRGDHPTQKPVGVMAWVLGQLPEATRSILDPFMGSGTTGVAAVQRGLRFVGVEREPRYFEVACRRIEAAWRQPRLFETPPSATPPAKQGALL